MRIISHYKLHNKLKVVFGFGNYGTLYIDEPHSIFFIFITCERMVEDAKAKGYTIVKGEGYYAHGNGFNRFKIQGSAYVHKAKGINFLGVNSYTERSLILNRFRHR